LSPTYNRRVGFVRSIDYFARVPDSHRKFAFTRIRPIVAQHS